MDEHPLLIFPQSKRATKESLPRGGPKLQKPTAKVQAERLTPQFQRLQRAMDQQRLFLQNNTFGLQPELTLVLETVGSVQHFLEITKKIEGFEGLGEFELGDVAPEYGFKDSEKPEKHLRRQLFLVMTDQRALHEMLSLYEKWRRNPTENFPPGLAPLKNAFAQLLTIRPWDAEDRIRETGLWDDWQDRIKNDQEIVPFEVELWFRENTDRQRQAQTSVENVIQSLGGQIINPCLIPEIAYHGILGNIPTNQLRTLVDEVSKLRNLRLLQCQDIMYLRPVGQCSVKLPEERSMRDFIEPRMERLPEGNPVIALLDGLPLTKHRLLDGRLIVDDPDGYEETYQAKERVHGTTMASLICHGDLNESGKPLGTPVYVRPIMKPYRNLNDMVDEKIPENILPVDLMHRAVRRLFESEGNEPPVAPSIRIINLSICDRLRSLDYGLSPWARLLDWLSWKYNVLFIVSAGNHSDEIELSDVPRNELWNLTAEDREKSVIKALAENTRHRRLLSPAETFNGITVGAIHEDASIPNPMPKRIDPFSRIGLPGTYSAHGPGYKRSIKPEILLPGGRQFLLEKLGTTHFYAALQSFSSDRPPGQLVAVPGQSGELSYSAYTRGTSNAAALASRWGAIILDVLNQLRKVHETSLAQDYDAVLLKTLLVHGADWSDAGKRYMSILKTEKNSRAIKTYIGQFIGYGLADVAKVLVCTDQRVTILGVGKLLDGEADEFLFPLPPCLSAITEKRKLTITLACITPINCKRHDYRIAQLWFQPNYNLASERICADNKAVQRGTIQHEVLEGENALDFQDGDKISIKVNCRAVAGDIPEPIRYGLAVTLEVAEGSNLPIYQEVRERLSIRIPIQGKAAT